MSDFDYNRVLSYVPMAVSYTHLDVYKRQGITASLDANGKVVFERDADTGEGGIEIIKGSSDFTTVLGFTKGGAQSAVTVEGNTAEIISKTAVSASKRFSAGDFTISLTGENAKDITDVYKRQVWVQA